MYIHNSVFHREIPFYEHAAEHISQSTHEGRHHIRKYFGHFTITGPDGNHPVLVQEPAQISIFDTKMSLQGERFEEDVAKEIIAEVLQAVDFLHTQCEAVHTGMCLDNRFHLSLDPC